MNDWEVEVSTRKICLFYSTDFLLYQINHQHKKHKLLLPLPPSLLSRPLKNDLIARCSEAYVIKDTKISPPTTINPNLSKENKERYMRQRSSVDGTMAREILLFYIFVK